MLNGYDNWKLDYPEHYDFEDEAECTCEGCEAEISEVVATESGLCEDCECSENCKGCVHCLCEAEYEERKAAGSL